MEQQNKRILGFDFARALAVFGMVLVNYKMVISYEQHTPSWLHWLISLFEGRAAATFVILAGIGISLLAQKATVQQDSKAVNRVRVSLLVRALLLFVIGLAYTPIWPADILHFYGVYLCVGVALLTARNTFVLAAATLSTVVFPLLLALFNYEKGWNWATLTYTDFWTVQGMVRHVFFNGFHPVFPWVAFLLVGVVIGRLNWADNALRKKLLFIGVIVFALSETLSFALSSLLGTALHGKDLVDLLALVGTKPMPPMPLYILSASASSLLVLIGSITIAERHATHTFVRALIQTGSMALTLYVAHVLIGMGVLEGLGLLHNQPLSFSVLYACCFFAVGILFSAFWRQRFQRGPLEALLRTISFHLTDFIVQRGSHNVQ